MGEAVINLILLGATVLFAFSAAVWRSFEFFMRVPTSGGPVDLVIIAFALFLIWCLVEYTGREQQE